MVKVFLCGPGGSGKTTIANDLLAKQLDGYNRIEEVARVLMKKKAINREDLKKFTKSQFQEYEKDILMAQCETEIEMEKSCQNFVSDRSIFDCFAYSMWRYPEHKEHNVQLELNTFVEKFKIESHVKKAVRRYQTSLFVIVYPWSNSISADDGMRYPMAVSDSQIFVKILKELLYHFKISFLDLKEIDRKERIKIIVDAIKHGKFQRESYSLQFYKELSERPKRNNKSKNPQNVPKPKVEYGQVVVSFYLDCNINKQIRSIYIAEDHIRLSLQDLDYKRGRIFSDLKFSEVATISFDKKIPPDKVQKMLLKNVHISGEMYTFLGCSNDGLKNRKAFFIKGDESRADVVLQRFGQFQEIKSVSKRMARIALLFSSVIITNVKITDEQIIDGNDIENKDFNFTDGCGGIGLKLAKSVYQSLPEGEKVWEPVGYIPSVYQFRLHGYKGVVAIDPHIQENKMLVRPSLRKFKSDSLPYFSVCNVSRPYRYGHLNRQLIYLLSARGVPDESFLELQEELFHLFSNMFVEKEAAITMLHWYEHYEKANLLLQSQEGLSRNTAIRTTLRKIMQEYLSKDIKVINKERNKEKLRIIVKKSRLIYGVADQLSKLPYGKCYLRVTVNGVPKTITGKILTARTPCYLKGDLRILDAVDIPELQHLVDCVVFPTNGDRPHADEQAGGDLDGDTFFVTWEERLIPPSYTRSPLYPGAAGVKEKEIDLCRMIQYFSLQNNSMKMIGLLNNLFESWANLKGADCEECRWIGQFFGRAIDSVKTGEKLKVPSCFLNPSPREGEDTKKRFVWQTLEARALESKAKKNERFVGKGVGVEESLEDVSLDYAESLLDDTFSSLSEFEKFKFVWKFSLTTCNQDVSDALEFMKEQFLNKINFSLFSTTEKIEAIDLGISPVVILNGLRKSDLFSSDDLEHYNMLYVSSGWGVVFQSQHCQLTFEDFISRIVCHDSILIIFKLPDSVCIAIKITQELFRGKEICLPVGSISNIFISKGFGYRKEYRPKENLYYDLYDGRFQIYRQKRVVNTFLSMSSQQFHAVTKNVNSRDMTIFDISKSELQDVLSVDLSSFDGNIIRPTGGNRPHPLVRKTPVCAIEVFASEKGRPCYPDVLIGNVTEIELDDPTADELEFIDEEIDSRDINKILIENLTEVNKRLSSLDGIKECLKNLVSLTAPWNCEMLPDGESALKKLLESVDVTNISWKDGFEIVSYLCKLGSLNTARNLLSNIKSDLTKEEFFEILSDWTLVWFMDPKDFIGCIQHMKTLLLSNTDLPSKDRYLIETIWNTIVEFVDDIDKCKLTWERHRITHMKYLENQNILNKRGQKDDSQQQRQDNEDDIVINLFRTKTMDKHPVLPALGDYVLLVRDKDYKRCNDIVGSVTAIASVINVTKFPISMELKLLNKQDIPGVLTGQEDCHWIVVLLSDANITLYTRIIKACSILIKEKSQILDYVCKTLNSETPRLPHSFDEISIKDGEAFNETQRKAISASFSSIITCIQGPPGCGKTKCACAIVREAVTLYRPHQILAVAETNTAVDNMTRKLKELGVKVVRVAGDLKKISPDVFDTTVEGRLRLLAQKEGKKVDFRASSGETMLKKQLRKKVLNDADVVLTTCAGAGENFLLERNFKFVLLDEATQTKQGTLLCVLAHQVEQLVLIGDPQQLGPLVKLKKGLPWLPDVLVEDASSELERSLFHKLHEADPNATHLLDTQYRMHPTIALFPSNTFYSGRVKSGVSAKSRQPTWQFGSSPHGFVHVDGEEKRHGTSYANVQEQHKIEQVISEMLKKPDISKENITVLSLYNGQVGCLRRSFPDIQVSSIDGFQGKENEYILVSTVRANYNLGHTDDSKRLNVLLTRAKRGLLIFGHRPTLIMSSLWRQWIESVEQIDI